MRTTPYSHAHQEKVDIKPNYSPDFLLQMIDSISDPIIVKDRQHRWILVNKASCNLIGYSSEILIGKSDYDFFSQADADTLRIEDEAVFTRGISQENSVYITDAKGVQHLISRKTSLFPDGVGNQFLVITIQNIIESSSVQSQTHTNLLQQRQAELTEKAALAAFHVEINHAITEGHTLQVTLKLCTQAMVNCLDAAFARIWTLNSEENVLELQASSGIYTHIDGPHGRVPVGMFKIGLIAQERQPHLTNQVLEDPRVGDKEWAKREGMVAFAGYPLILEDNLIGVIAMFSKQPLSDSTLEALKLAANEIALGIKRVKTEQALKESERQYRQLVETSQDMIWTLDTQGCWTFVNPAVKDIYGYESEEIIGHHYSEFEPPEQTLKNLKIFSRILSQESVFHYETVIISKDGRRVNLLCNASVVKDSAGNIVGVTGTATNITELKQAEATVSRNNAILTAQQEASLDAILIIDENRCVASYNGNFSKLWKLPEELINNGDDHQLLEYVLNQLAQPQEFLSQVEYLYQHPDENSFDEILLKDGRILDRYSAPVLGSEGDYYGRIWYFRDITERKQAEVALLESKQQLKNQAQELEEALCQLQRSQTQLIHNEKMSSLGQLVAGVAHEINNPINFINGNIEPASEYTQDLLSLLELYEQEYPQPVAKIQELAEDIDLEFLKTDLPRLLDSMKVGADRIREIVLSLRNFSRLDEAEMKDVNIHEGIDSTLMILQNRLKGSDRYAKIEVIKDYGQLPPVECYPGQLNQVFMNLLANAIDALDEIRTTEKTPAINIRTQLADHNQVTISIADNGIGISEKIKKRIFDPFFTTKSVGKGTGMGLAISHQIITEKHGGSLQCAANPQRGTEFIITIPISQEI
jgi:two-component system NtrC family sensor kinase